LNANPEPALLYAVDTCAVVGCERRGTYHTCPYDGSRHHHGLIHFENNHPAHPDMQFDDKHIWKKVCDEHFQQIDEAVIAYRRQP